MKKLIRDNIPEIMKSKWLECNYYKASEFEYTIELFKKLIEESIEVKNSKGKTELIEELADVMEVINSICINNEIHIDEIEAKRLKKLKDRWWFEKKYIYEFNI
jgi:predicted house-cleaning noncanonical NTP pyrophosphatase (MazG superfamily)